MDGPFTLDDVEDLNTTASGVDRAWIPDYIESSPNAFAPVTLANSNLGLVDDQTSIGALRIAVPSAAKAGYVSYSFGVPMPSQPGKSTETFPGDISSFTEMTFLVTANKTLANSVNSVLLETYPGPTFPQLVWNFTLPTDGAFHRITLPLREPSTINNNNSAGHTVDELLAQVRYLSFYFYGGPQTIPVTLTVHIDDIRFTGDANQSGVSDWSIY